MMSYFNVHVLVARDGLQPSRRPQNKIRPTQNNPSFQINQNAAGPHAGRRGVPHFD